jgi:hypothetical protein
MWKHFKNPTPKNENGTFECEGDDKGLTLNTTAAP